MVIAKQDRPAVPDSLPRIGSSGESGTDWSNIASPWVRAVNGRLVGGFGGWNVAASDVFYSQRTERWVSSFRLAGVSGAALRRRTMAGRRWGSPF